MNNETNVFLEDWKHQQLEALMKMFPLVPKQQILAVLDKDIKDNFKDPNSMLHNDYQDDMELRQPLSLIYRFAKERKPILAGNGTLFYNQDEKYSPVADLIDDRIDTRAYYKGLMKDTQKRMAQYE